MSDNAINEAVQFYREARQLRHQAMKPKLGFTASALDSRARSNMRAFTLLEKIITLGQTSEALRRHQVYALAHRYLGLLRRSFYSPNKAQQKRYHQEVVDHLTAALHLGLGKDAAICHALGAAYLYLGEHAEAAQYLEEALTFHEGNVHARYLLSYSYLALHDRERARQQYEALRQRAPHLVERLEHNFNRPEKEEDEVERQELLRSIEEFRARRQC